MCKIERHTITNIIKYREVKRNSCMGSGNISQWISITIQLQISLSKEKFLHGKWIYFTVVLN